MKCETIFATGVLWTLKTCKKLFDLLLEWRCVVLANEYRSDGVGEVGQISGGDSSGAL